MKTWWIKCKRYSHKFSELPLLQKSNRLRVFLCRSQRKCNAGRKSTDSCRFRCKQKIYRFHSFLHNKKSIILINSILPTRNLQFKILRLQQQDYWCNNRRWRFPFDLLQHEIWRLQCILCNNKCRGSKTLLLQLRIRLHRSRSLSSETENRQISRLFLQLNNSA